ncbi:MAG: type IX secretion system membrane protein PorP/SprF [Bacteroidia bacterium]|nr:type IX secretion system membrane protein PorP/SprF [Bacteroidia bacterium]
MGLYYTYNDRVTLGAATRRGKVVNATLGLKVTPTLMLGYSREMIMGNVGGYVGSANEFTLRLDFNRAADKQHFSSDYKSAVSYRHKTLSSNAKPGGRNPKQLRKKQRKLAPYSPNKRYQNMKKLSTTKKKGYGGANKKRQRKAKSYQRKNKRRH